DAHRGGASGKALVERDALGRDVTTTPVVIKAPTPGAGVRLTIDTTIQYLAERELDAAYRRTGARAAIAVIMDPRTGELLGLAVRPTFNPNTFALATAREWRDRAGTDPFEPGSTFKVVLAAAPLVGALARDAVDRPGDLGHRDPARGRGGRRRQRRTADAAANRARGPRRRGPRAPRLRAPSRPAGDLARHRADADAAARQRG